MNEDSSDVARTHPAPIRVAGGGMLKCALAAPGYVSTASHMRACLAKAQPLGVADGHSIPARGPARLSHQELQDGIFIPLVSL